MRNGGAWSEMLKIRRFLVIACGKNKKRILIKGEWYMYYNMLKVHIKKKLGSLMQIYVIGIQSPKKRKIQMFSGFVLVYAVDER